MKNHVSFPGLGLDFNLNETAIENCFGIEGFNIQWYGIILSFGIICAFLLFYFLATKKEEIDPDSAYNITLLVVPIAIFGARFVYVVTEWEHYAGKGLAYMINIRNGGIAIYGAIIFGLITVLIYNKIKKQSSLSMLDALAPAVMLGQTIGRWGNFMNAEAYGWSESAEKMPWRMVLDHVYVDDVYMGKAAVHPTFLYESLWNAIGLILIFAVFYRKKRFNGQIFCVYMGWYGLGRAFIEMIRADSLYIPGTTLKFSVLVGFLCLISAVICWFVFSKRQKEEEAELAEYTPAYAKIRAVISGEENALDESVYESEEEEIDLQAIDEIEDTEEEIDEIDEIVALEEIDEAELETLSEQDLIDGDIEDTDN